MNKSLAFLFCALFIMVIALLTGACADNDDDDSADQNPSEDDTADDDSNDDDISDDDASDDDAGDDDSGDDDSGDDDSGDDDSGDDDSGDDDSGDDDSSPGDYWEPSTVVPIGVYPEIRGLMVERGIIHIHSVYSHDACDNNPMPGGQPNEKCLAELREAMCTTNQQYIMLTDHASIFADNEFPDVLLYRPDEGDELVYDDDDPIANIISCPDGNKTILMAGSENDLMPLHLHRAPGDTPEERHAVLGAKDEAAVELLKTFGAQLIVNHSELWTTEELAALSIDGIELYNLHANLGTETWPIVETVLKVLPYLFPRDEAGHCDLLLMSFFEENATDLAHFDKLLALRRQVGVLATDVHRNSIPFPLWDGDRGDSYRRLMRWFANYILVENHEVPDIEEALAKGRMYGAFQLFGEPVGFDFYAQTAKSVAEMGDEIALDDDPVLHVEIPTFYNMDPTLPAPEFSARIIQAGADGGTVVAESDGDPIDYQVTESGAYRVEVHVVPNHLLKWLGGHPDRYIHEYPLIYANPIYVTE
ncbi:MAG: hypothetical protein GX444_01400 [Myxococcales bacterium]|nr:hypothetical protein [Myxococcales bacterium]